MHPPLPLFDVWISHLAGRSNGGGVSVRAEGVARRTPRQLISQAQGVEGWTGCRVPHPASGAAWPPPPLLLQLQVYLGLARKGHMELVRGKGVIFLIESPQRTE